MHIYALRAADVDGDTRLDLIAGGYNLQILIADGLGGFFQPAPSSLPEYYSNAIGIADFNGDRFPDLISGTSMLSGQLSILINYSPKP